MCIVSLNTVMRETLFSCEFYQYYLCKFHLFHRFSIKIFPWFHTRLHSVFRKTCPWHKVGSAMYSKVSMLINGNYTTITKFRETLFHSLQCISCRYLQCSSKMVRNFSAAKCPKPLLHKTNLFAQTDKK